MDHEILERAMANLAEARLLQDEAQQYLERAEHLIKEAVKPKLEVVDGR